MPATLQDHSQLLSRQSEVRLYRTFVAQVSGDLTGATGVPNLDYTSTMHLYIYYNIICSEIGMASRLNS